ncbi:3-oxoacyl-[acyl-carrier-protein] synthase III C-terminal domain-containing protein [Massilia cavernae]|uniref:Hydroxymethylglutaryl-CoA synthase family protein n=1 Tax=Massilia cavernae TaxID=2320864 RepID=A0A418Y6K5_9BURK|nr:3-oxoacyl-[acyl-carrier-protein] synthase III C-terminal domain-containing protein [Massilia cavernae]RJG23477.1 hydroxymethylglutaryl-CoA synthase family protein [Massilia cavernae]
MERGITSFGAYIPNLRIERTAIAAAHSWSFPSLKAQAKGVRALANWDEDTITMGVEAARGVNCAGVGAIAFASTNAPFADLQNATLVAAALGLPAEIATTDAGGSLRAGSSALLAALRSSSAGNTLVVASDARFAKPGSVQEMQFGAGAIALTVGTEKVIAKLLGAASRADQFVDHFRAMGDKYDYYWEERWVRDEGYLKIIPPAVAAVLEQAGIGAGAIAHFCLPGTLGGIAGAVAKKLGIAADAVVDNLAARCGDTGTAHGLLMLGAALERARPGDKILLVTFGAGCDALLFEATEALADYRPARSVAAALAGGRAEAHYTKMLSFHGQIELDWGMRSEGAEKIPLTQQYRARDQLARFAAGECADCGAVQFPQLASCVNCGSFAPLTPRLLSDEPAKVATYTADWLQFYPAPPLYFGLVQFDNGARVMMEMVDVDPAQLEVGTPLRMVYRIKSRDAERHYHRYFWKATPIVSKGD